jgi:hypothetical protein
MQKLMTAAQDWWIVGIAVACEGLAMSLSLLGG